MQMGGHAKEYLNNYKYLNQSITLKDTVYAVTPASEGIQAHVDFAAGPCIVTGGNIIRCFLADSEPTKEPGQLASVSGTLTDYGRLPLRPEENVSGCGYYIVLRGCRVVQ